MSDETRERYISAVSIICEQFGLNKPSQIIYVCKAVDRLIEEYRKENKELKEKIKGLEAGEVCWQGDMDATIKQNLALKSEVKELRNTLDLVTAEWNKEREWLKMHCKAVDDVNEKMKCCQNCNNYDCTETCEHKDCKYQYSKCIETDETGDYWELAE